MKYTFYYVLTNEEIDNRVKQLQDKNVKDAIIITAEEFGFKYLTSIRDKNFGKEYCELISKLADCSKLILKYAQFLIGKTNTISFLQTIIKTREEMEKFTTIFSASELDFTNIGN